MPLNLDSLDQSDARLVQAGLKHFGFYDGTMLGRPGPKTRAAYERYRGEPEDTAPVEPAEMLTYPRSVRDEMEFPGAIAEGTRGRKARRVQEWLTIQGFRTAIDDDFGSATKRALEAFQQARGLSSTGTVDEESWKVLVAPMARAFAKTEPGSTFGDTLLRVARQHLKEHPIELGGANCGPWVRAYMDGNQGEPWAWCAGFVTFVMKQAADIHGVAKPLKGSFSCDLLATQAKEEGRFISGHEISTTPAEWSEGNLGTCCVFLVRRTSSDWTHTGFAFDYRADGTFASIEGNTNDEGNREGYEVCRRVRGRGSMDFIRLV